MPLKTGSSPKAISSNIRTDIYSHVLILAIAGLILCACVIARPVDVALAGQPPTRLTGDIVTLVEWKSAEAVAVRCAQLQAISGQLPTGGHGCAYAQNGGPITLVLPRDLHPLISHELGHAHQLAKGEPVTHKEYR
jgi:hypothetical protein